MSKLPRRRRSFPRSGASRAGSMRLARNRKPSGTKHLPKVLSSEGHKASSALVERGLLEAGLAAGRTDELPDGLRRGVQGTEGRGWNADQDRIEAIIQEGERD